ncbi:uncharacterized protein VP01_1175g5 [Puccinia sorghi]|uniref:Uncharacterized protein n=1 Tax=Puccinia sorghi TaxID=27349 RepID=A0A0L6VR45_9BASI|nr:uncharacterized protein VP01_1175g5 [Puccinia sorghi]
MSELDPSSIKLVTKKLDVDNFSAWRWGIITALGYKNLNDYILSANTPEMVNSVDYKSRRKQVTNFIRMHLSHSNLERFVPDITDYNPKKLWDDIVAYFAAKTIENSLDRLFDTQLHEGDMKSNVNSFRSAFQRVVKDDNIEFDSFLKDGKHNPKMDYSHSEENCWHVHPLKAVEYHEAAAERAKARVTPRASLSAITS